MTTFTDPTLQNSKFNLSQTSFIIHFRKDSDDRIFNLKCVLKYLTTHMNCGEIFLINDDAVIDPCLEEIKQEFPNVLLAFYKNEGVYHRTLCFDRIAKIATKPVLCFYDTDVIVRASVLEKSQNLIIQNKVDHVYPYNGLFVDVKKEYRDVISNYDFEYLEKNLTSTAIGFDNEIMTVAHDASVGGLHMMSKDGYFRMGGYDVGFIGWGCEDVDIYTKSGKHNRVARITDENAICWHIHHDNTIRTENEHYTNNQKLLYSNSI